MTPAFGQAAPQTTTASAPAYPGLPLRRDTDTGTGTIAWLGVLLVLAAGLGLVWRRRAATPLRNAAEISVKASRALTPQASLHVVEWEGERLLVACTQQSADVISRRLSEVPPPGHGVSR